MTTRESFNAVNYDKEVKMMKRMECKLSQDVRVEARFGPDTTKEPVRIVPELSLKLRDLLVQEGTKVVEVVLTTVIQPKKSKLISACAPVAKELFRRRILFIFYLHLLVSVLTGLWLPMPMLRQIFFSRAARTRLGKNF